jgi:hypothetical protein
VGGGACLGDVREGADGTRKGNLIVVFNAAGDICILNGYIALLIHLNHPDDGL